jgi:hypothetical protein
VSSHARRSLSLAPKHSGDLRIPPISWGREQSEPLTVHVGGAPPANAQASTSRTVFVETSAETARLYVQAQVDVTVRVYSQVPLYHASLELPSSNDVLVQQIGADRNETLVKDGVRYQVVERHYALFPQRSGSLTVPGPVLDAQIAVRDRNSLGFGDLFGNMRPLNDIFATLRPIKEHGEDLSLNVLPRPDGALGDYWLPARDVKLGAEWRPDSAQVNAGDPVTLHLHLQAQGLTAAQLPDLSLLLQLPPGVRAYPDQAKLGNETHGDVLLGTRDQDIALIADQPGQFKLPSLTIHWWDVQSNQPRETTLPERILTVLPVAAAQTEERARTTSNPVAQAPAPTSSASARGSAITAGGDLWRWVSVALGSLWILTLIAWYLTRRRGDPHQAKPPRLAAEEHRVSISEARRAFHDACRRSEARTARAALIRWITTAQPDRGPVGLRAFSKEMKDSELSSLLADLDRACYANGSWSGARLLAALQDLPLRFPDDEAPIETLSPLYR